MMGAIFIFGESSFIFSFVIYGLVIKLLEVGCTFENVEKKKKMSKDEYESFSNLIRMNHVT
jgi:hypothetical protein